MRPAPCAALHWAPALLYMALIWAMSSLEMVDLPLGEVPLRDKGLHFVEYAVLGFLVCHAVLRTFPRVTAARAVGLAILVTAAWGLLDELHQAFVPGRASELLDLVADAAGALAGSAARYGVALRGRQRRKEARA